MKQLVKNFNNLIKKTIFKVQNKTNNKLLLFKVKNKADNKLLISKFNKYLITLISLLFFYLFYLLIPILYDKNWVQKNIENQLIKEFRIYFSLSSEISYHILPSPHYLVKDSKILKEEAITESLADIKNLKIFISQKNFFNKEKMLITNVKINNADFIILNDDLKYLKNSTNNKFSNKKIEINNSNLFFKNNLNEIISIIKISKAFLIQNDNELSNLFNLKGEVFNIPFNLNYNRIFNPIDGEEINIDIKKLKLKIFNFYRLKENNNKSGKNIISFLNSKINTNYRIENNIYVFSSANSKIKNSKATFNGKMSIKPFDLNLNINLNEYDLHKLFDYDSILNELIKTQLLFNENISINTSIKIAQNLKNKIFQNTKINFNINNGKIDFNKTKLINKKIGFIELENSNLSYTNNKLILNTDILVNIKNYDKLFSLLQTNKRFRKPIRNILINLDYNFLSKEINFNNIKIDNSEIDEEVLRIIYSLDYNKLNNWNKSKRILNTFFQFYEG